MALGLYILVTACVGGGVRLTHNWTQTQAVDKKLAETDKDPRPISMYSYTKIKQHSAQRGGGEKDSKVIRIWLWCVS